MDLLKHYVLSDPDIEEWHLWDNCRDPEDRRYIEMLATSESRIRLIRIENPDGTNRSVNRFYRFCSDPRAFYIKMDDDLVYFRAGLASSLYEAAARERDDAIWWSPLVINNAICSWLLQKTGRLITARGLTAQAGCPVGWLDPTFAVLLHRAFIEAQLGGTWLCVPDVRVASSRFSINCLGFFGEDVVRLKENFCPHDVDDEEWISAVLPMRENKFGRIVGAALTAHYSFFTQEAVLNRTDILDRYYDIAGLQRRYSKPAPRRPPIWGTLRRLVNAAKRRAVPLVGAGRLKSQHVRIQA